MPKPLVSQNLNPRCASIQLTFSLTSGSPVKFLASPTLLLYHGSVGLGVDWHPYAEAWAFPICTAG